MSSFPQDCRGTDDVVHDVRESTFREMDLFSLLKTRMPTCEGLVLLAVGLRDAAPSLAGTSGASPPAAGALPPAEPLQLYRCNR